MDGTSVKPDSRSIHPDTSLGPVTLRISNLDRSKCFYKEVIGLRQTAPVEGLPSLGVGDKPIVVLKEVEGARPAPGSCGLYHFAILVPTRRELGRALRRLVDAQIEMGEADHLVSEALYLSDPDGNGIEIYRDRPRSQWKWKNGMIEMTIKALDMDELLREGEYGPDPIAGIADGTRMGHLHLQVSDLDQGLEFYHGVVGFDVMASLRGAVFLSAGAYHHHLGLNNWSTEGMLPAPAGSAGLESFVIQVPDVGEQSRLEAMLRKAGSRVENSDGVLRVRDPWSIEIRFVVDDHSTLVS